MGNTDKKVDRRIQRARRLLQQGMIGLIAEKGYEAASIQDITDRAKVVRTTFYLPYSDRDELLFGSVRDVIEDLPSAIHPGSEWTPASLEHISRHADFYRAILGEHSSSAVISRWRAFVANAVRERMSSQLASPDKKPRVPLDFMTHYLVGASVGVAAWWLHNDVPYSTAKMAQMADDLANRGAMWAQEADETTSDD